MNIDELVGRLKGDVRELFEQQQAKIEAQPKWEEACKAESKKNAKLHRDIEDLQGKIVEQQRLCERAYLILSETWDEHTDEEGYGPVSLLRDLEKAKDGKALKDNYLLIDLLQAEITRLRGRLEYLSDPINFDPMKYKCATLAYHRQQVFDMAAYARESVDGTD